MAVATRARQDVGALEWLAFLRSIELAALQAYTAATSGTSSPLGPEARDALQAVTAHHQVHAGDLTALLEGRAPEAPNPKLLDDLRVRLGAATDQASTLTVFSEFELQLAATYSVGAATVVDGAAVSRIAGILPVEASHGVALGVLAGRVPGVLFGQAGLFTPASAFTLDRFPI